MMDIKMKDNQILQISKVFFIFLWQLMVKTRSADAPPNKTKPKYRQLKKKKHGKKKRCHDSDGQEIPNPAKFTYFTELIPFQQNSFDPQQCLISMGTNIKPCIPQQGLEFNQYFDKLEVIEIMEHKPDSNNQAQEQINSNASTQNKISHSQSRQRMSDFDSQFGFTMEGNKMIPNEFNNDCQENLDVMPADMQIEKNIEQNMHNSNLKKNQKSIKGIAQTGNNFQLLPETMQNQQQIQEIALLVNQEEPQAEHVENLAPFGPPNIDDLSTNDSLNTYSQQYIIQQLPQVRHIQIHQQDNDDNISQESTRPCISHPSQGQLEQVVYDNIDEEYNAILWKIASGQAKLTLSLGELIARLKAYLIRLIQYATKEITLNLTHDQKFEFWAIFDFIKSNLRDQVCVDLMIKFIKTFLLNGFDEASQFGREYILIKERLQSLKKVCERDHYNHDSISISLMLQQSFIN